MTEHHTAQHKPPIIEAVDRLADNSGLKVFGRIAMVLTVPLTGFLGAYVYDISKANASVAKDIAEVSNRVDVIETRINIGQRQREDFQDQMLNAVGEIQRTQTLILQQNAALLAKFEAVDKRVDRLDR